MAGITHKIIVLGSEQYLPHIVLVIYSMFYAYPAIGILVIPGKSIRVRSGHEWEKMFNNIGLSTIFFLSPATLSVNVYIIFLTS